MSYTAGIVPQEWKLAVDVLQRELELLQLEFERIHDYEVLRVAPNNPYEGMVRYANGTDWDPGSGKGLYLYDGSTWNKL